MTNIVVISDGSGDFEASPKKAGQEYGNFPAKSLADRIADSG